MHMVRVGKLGGEVYIHFVHFYTYYTYRCQIILLWTSNRGKVSNKYDKLKKLLLIEPNDIHFQSHRSPKDQWLERNLLVPKVELDTLKKIQTYFKRTISAIFLAILWFIKIRMLWEYRTTHNQVKITFLCEEWVSLFISFSSSLICSPCLIIWFFSMGNTCMWNLTWYVY